MGLAQKQQWMIYSSGHYDSHWTNAQLDWTLTRWLLWLKKLTSQGNIKWIMWWTHLCTIKLRYYQACFFDVFESLLECFYEVFLQLMQPHPLCPSGRVNCPCCPSWPSRGMLTGCPSPSPALGRPTWFVRTLVVVSSLDQKKHALINQ